MPEEPRTETCGLCGTPPTVLKSDYDTLRACAMKWKADAERYLWLRLKVPDDVYYEIGVVLELGGIEEIDAAIDAEIAKARGG